MVQGYRNRLRLKDIIWTIFHPINVYKASKFRQMLFEKLRLRQYLKSNKEQYRELKYSTHTLGQQAYLATSSKPSERLKNEVALFIEQISLLRIYYDSLIKDGHSQVEIQEKMQFYQDRAIKNAHIYAFNLTTHTRIFDEYSKEEQDEKFFTVLNFARSYYEHFEFKKFILEYVASYGKIESLSTYYLKAIIDGDFELSEVLKMYL